MDKHRNYNRNLYVLVHEGNSKMKERVAHQKAGVLAEKELARESKETCTAKSRLLDKKCKY